MAQSRHYKAVNFDLDTEELRRVFGEPGRTLAYSQIRSYLESHGFEHRQGSGYRSLKALSDLDVSDLVVDMYAELNWLPDCVKRLDVTNIGRDYDLDAVAKRRMAEEKATGRDVTFDVSL